MKQVIYIDILIAVNLFVNYFILLATAKFLCIKWKTWRLIIGETLGAIYSLYIFLPMQNGFIESIIKFLMAFTIIWATFGIKNIKIFIKSLLCFYLTSFAFSGLMLAIWQIWSPKNMAVNNGIVYFNISPTSLIVFTVISYIIIETANKIVGKHENKKTWCQVGVQFKGKYTDFKAKIDTGNSLKEPFSNLPVIVVRQNIAEEILGKLQPPDLFTNINNSFKTAEMKFRMVPFKTVAGEGIMPAFKPDFVNISKSIHKEAYIAVCSNKILPQETLALVNPDLID